MGEMHGFGVYTYANGDVYQGPVVRNCFEGEGIFTYAATGDRYQGDFQQHRMTGKGTMHYANGDKYVGDWVDGKRCGEGFCAYATGDTYQGSWDADRFHGEGVWCVARLAAMPLEYRGAFIEGVPTTVPVRVNALFDVVVDPKKPPKPPAKGEVVLPTPLQVTIGQPIPSPLTIAAQFEEPLPPPPPPEPEPPGGAKAAGAAAKKTAAPPPAPVTVFTEPPAQGNCFRTAAMESKRVVNLTLHKEPPAALPAGLQVRALVCAQTQADGEVGVRLVLLFVHVDAPLPLGRVEGQPITSLQVSLSEGQCVLSDLTIGAAEDTEKLSVPGGIGHLVVTSWGLRHGYIRVTLPELKVVKKPGGK